MSESPKSHNPWNSFRAAREEQRPRASVFLRVMLVLICIAAGAGAGALVAALLPYSVARYSGSRLSVMTADTAKKANRRMAVGAIIGGMIPPLWLIKVWRGARR